jgi:hypothetical protein
MNGIEESLGREKMSADAPPYPGNGLDFIM